VVTDAAGTVLRATPGVWRRLGGLPDGGALLLADIVTALGPEVRLQSMPMTDGTVAHVLLERRSQPRRAIARENRLLRETLDAIDGSICVHDGDLRFRLSNRAYRERYPHLPPDREMVGWHFADTLRVSARAGSYADPRALSDTEAYIAERVAEMAVRENSVTNRQMASTHPRSLTGRWSQMRVRWTPSGNRVTLRVDITTDKRMEEELVRTERIRTVGRIAGGVAHHFNNMLAVVCTNIELLLRLPNLTDRAKRLAARALDGAERGRRITQQLLTFAQGDFTRPRRIDANRLLESIAALLEGMLGSGATLAMRLDSEQRHVSVDPEGFETAMINLVLNARDAMPGQIEIRTALHRQDGRLFRVVSVADDGEGMSPEVAAEAFEPFFTTRTASAASGLGLSQVHGFATAAGGAVTLRSTPGHGTVVDILLPVGDESTSETEGKT
jgi:signal transduction histidine kinase